MLYNNLLEANNDNKYKNKTRLYTYENLFLLSF